jgi:hypothetical protein
MVEAMPVVLSVKDVISECIIKKVVSGYPELVSGFRTVLMDAESN